MSDESTTPTEEPKSIVPQPPKPEEDPVNTFTQSIEKTEAGFEKAEKFVKLVAENLRYGSWTKRFVTIGGVAFLAFNPFTVGKIGEVFGVRELPQWYWTSFYGGMGGIAVGAVGAAIVTLPKRTLEAMPERQAIKGLRSFEFKDAEIFKRLERGRDVQECLDAIDTEDLRLFLLMGESGVGKSSLLQAGLMPNFGKIGMGGVYVKLGDRDPIVVIRKALGGSEGEDFVGMLRSAVAKNGKPIVLILDQFEQFFVQFQEAERGAFIGELKAWYESNVAVKILIGIRGDLSDRLVEIQKALGYSLSPTQVHRMEKFAPEQATEVLRVIAETEKWSFNEAFVLEMSRDQLAGLDGKVAPVEVQVLAQMVSREPSEDNRRFDKTSFQKLGGVDGLLGRSLQRSLDAIPGKSDRDRALQVLLALTDLDRNVRSGAFSIVQLQGMTEKVHGSPSDVAAAVGWLAESRLISPGDGDGAVVVYELAHERLIPALRVVANRELSDVNKANLLLDRRVNEWLGSGKNRRYLFSLKELGLLRKQRGFLEWGQQRSQKETLVKNSWNRSRWGLGAIGMPLGMGLAFIIWSNTPPGQIQWTRWDLRTLDNMRVLEYDRELLSDDNNLSTGSNLDMISGFSHQPFPNLWIKWFALERYDLQEMRRTIQMTSKLKNRNSAKQLLRQIELVADNFPNNNKAELLSQLSAVWVDFEEVDHSRKLLDMANTAIPSIKDKSSQSRALSSIAQAYGKLGDGEKGKQVLEKALDATKSIKDESSQSRTLSSIAQASGKLGDAEKGKQTLEKALVQGG